MTEIKSTKSTTTEKIYKVTIQTQSTPKVLFLTENWYFALSYFHLSFQRKQGANPVPTSTWKFGSSTSRVPTTRTPYWNGTDFNWNDQIVIIVAVVCVALGLFFSLGIGIIRNMCGIESPRVRNARLEAEARRRQERILQGNVQYFLKKIKY